MRRATGILAAALLVPVLPAVPADSLLAFEGGFVAPAEAIVRAAGVRLGTGVCAGLYEFADAPGVCTHGPDEYRGATDAGAGGKVLFRQASRIPCSTSGPYVRVFYVYDGANKLDAPNPNALRPYIREAVGIANEIVDRSARQKGARRHVRWKMDSGCELKIVPAKIDTGYSPGFMREILIDRGKLNRRDKALIFIHGGSCWGVGTLYPDDRASSTNPNNRIGSAARVQLGCIDIGSDSIALGEVAAHEMFHTFGAVQDSAPRATGYGHCKDESDVMCYRDAPWVSLRSVCTRTVPELLDCKKNDYFNPKPTSGSYLKRRWNTARIDYLRASTPGKRDLLERPSIGLPGLSAGDVVGGMLALTATASAPPGASIEQVRFFANGAPIETDTSAPFEATLETRFNGSAGFRNGQSLTIRAEATDSYRRVGSRSVALTVGNPTIRLVEPGGRSLRSTGDVAWSADASAWPGRTVSKVELLLDGAVVQTDVTAPYGGTFDASEIGWGTLRARVTDSAGVTRTTPPRDVEFSGPQVSLLPSYRTATGSVTFAADVDSPSGEAIDRVEFRADGVLKATDTTPPYTGTWTPLAGTYEIEARAVDATGAEGVTVGSLDAVASTSSVTLNAPSAGATVTGDTTLTATVSAGSQTVWAVDFYVDDTYVGSDSAAPYSIPWDSTEVENGTHVIVALSFADDEAYSVGTVVTVDNPMPSLDITAPSGVTSGTTSVTVQAAIPTGMAVDGVDVSAGWSWLGSDATAPYSIPFNTTTFPDGPVRLHASAFVSGSWFGVEDDHTVTLLNLGAKMSKPAAGSTVSGKVTVGAKVTTDSEAIVEWVRFYVDGVSIGRDGTAPYTRVWKTGSWSPGPHELTARVTTTDGRSRTSSARTVIVAN